MREMILGSIMEGSSNKKHETPSRNHRRYIYEEEKELCCRPSTLLVDDIHLEEGISQQPTMTV